MRTPLNEQNFRKSQFYMLQATDFQAPIFEQIASAAKILLELKALRGISSTAVLLSERERFYDACNKLRL